jgi:hypothetical protein
LDAGKTVRKRYLWVQDSCSGQGLCTSEEASDFPWGHVFCSHFTVFLLFRLMYCSLTNVWWLIVLFWSKMRKLHHLKFTVDNLDGLQSSLIASFGCAASFSILESKISIS